MEDIAKNAALWELIDATGDTRVQAISQLIRDSGDVDIVVTGRTLLMEAACIGAAKLVQAVAHLGAKIDRKESLEGTEDGDTALHLAIRQGHQPVVETLLQCRADPLLRAQDGTTALQLASGNVALMDTIIPYVPFRERCKEYTTAACESRTELLFRLLKSGVDVNFIKDPIGQDEMFGALHYAAQDGNLLLTQKLLEVEGIEVDLPTRADYSTQYRSADVCDDKTALHIAAYEGHGGCAKCLIEAEADVNQVTELEATPLLMALDGAVHRLPHDPASESGREPGIAPGAACGAVDPSSGPSAPERASLDVRAVDTTVELLLHAEADPNVQVHNGDTCLQKAVRLGSVALLACLLEHNADVNATGRLRRTALHSAVVQGDAECVRALLRAGAEVGLRDSNGKTPVDLAEGDLVGLLKGQP